MKHEQKSPLFALALVAAMCGAGAGMTTAVQAAAPAARPAVELPSVESILANCVKAVGGQEAVDKIKTLQVNSTMSMDGQSMDFEQSWQREGGRLMRMKTQMGDILMGTDGKTAWMKGPSGYVLAPPEQAKDMEAQTDMYMFMLDPKKLAEHDLGSLKVVGEEEFDGKNCYKIHFEGKHDNSGHMYFDTESGMPVGLVQTVNAEDGDAGTFLLKDWKEVEGVQFFHLITLEVKPGPNSTSQPHQGEMRVTKIEVNTLEPAFFALPEQVKAMTTDAPKTGGDAAPAKEIKFEDLSPEQQTQAKNMIDGMKNLPAAYKDDTLKKMEEGLPNMDESRRKMVMYVLQELKKS